MGITSSVVTNLLPSSLLASEAKRTDKLLDSLGERANSIDINVRRLSSQIKAIQKHLDDTFSETIRRDDLSSIHIQINSLLINLNGHLACIYPSTANWK